MREELEALVLEKIAPHAVETDRAAVWPAHSFAALKDEGFMGLNVSRDYGGRGEGLFALALCTETIGRSCASSAICFGMHCVGAAVISAKATPYHVENYLRPIAEGRHITTLSLSESGTGAQFYLPETKLTRRGDKFEVTGTKQFVTNAGQADSYVISTTASDLGAGAGDFTCLLVDKSTPGLRWGDPWEGFGMRGNSALALTMEGITVGTEQLLGQEGDQIWYVFEVVAPYFLVAMAGTYLGVAQAVLDETLRHLKSRTHTTTGDALASLSTVQVQVAEMWARVERTRLLLYHAAQLGDLGQPGAIPYLLGSKIEAAETAVWAANEAMTLCGGIAYRENSELSRLLRDARASHVMSPTTALLRLWTGRALLGQSLL